MIFLELRDIPDFPGYYACNDGNILTDLVVRRGLPPLTDGPLRVVDYVFESNECQTWKAAPYPKVRLRNACGRWKEVPVHRLVLMAFAGLPPRERMHSRHLNGDPLDNRPTNLAWGTAGRKLTVEQVRAIRASALPSATLAAQYGVTYSCILKIRHRLSWAWLDPD